MTSTDKLNALARIRSRLPVQPDWIIEAVDRFVARQPERRPVTYTEHNGDAQ